MKILIAGLLMSLTSFSAQATGLFDGSWKGLLVFGQGRNDSRPAEASILGSGQRVVGFIKGWNDENLPFSGYVDPTNSRKLILATWYDQRPHTRIELTLSSDGKHLTGGKYTFERKDQDLTLDRQ